MSMINEQVKELRGLSNELISYDGGWFNRRVVVAMTRAADTIEALSTKLQAANYDAEWIACEDRLPGKKGWYLVYAKNQRPFVAYFKGKTFPLNNHYHEIVAWRPLPEPYRP